MLTKFEMETIVLFNEAEDTAEVSAYSQSLIHRLEKLSSLYPNEVVLVKQKDRFAEYRIPKKWIKIAPPPNLTEEDRERKRNRMEALRASKAPSIPVDDHSEMAAHHPTGDSFA